MANMKEDVKAVLLGFMMLLLSFLMGGLALPKLFQWGFMSAYGLEPVIWTLIIGLILGNTLGIPLRLKWVVKTELFIKTGLVMMGAEVLLQTLLKFGALGFIQAAVVIATVFSFCIWVARRFGLDDEFAAILASAVSICGVSAAITAGGAINGDPKKVSHTVSLVLLCAIPMLILEPIVARYLGLPSAVTGAWIGGTIDTTGAVVAAGSIAGKEAMSVAVVVKMTQNAFIGVAAFLLSVWFTLKGVKKSESKVSEIWKRFPKFVLGFIAASIIFSLLPASTAKEITNVSKVFRGWWFMLAFFCIGLETKFKELISMGGGKPAKVFLTAQVFNIFFTLLLAYILFGGL